MRKEQCPKSPFNRLASVTEVGLRTVRSRRAGNACSEGNLDTGILSLGQRVRVDPGTPGPLRVQSNGEMALSGSWQTQTQIMPKENSPQLGLLEDRLRLSIEIINTKFNKHRGRDHSTTGASQCTQSKGAHTINAKYRRKRVSKQCQWQATPVLLPRKSHGWRSLVGCSPWGRKESDTTERLN